MKVLTFTTIILLSAFSQAFSQNLFINSYVEKTKVSPKVGMQLGYTFQCGHEIGIFYQKEADLPGSHESNKPRVYEQEFYGVNLAFNLVSFRKLDLMLDVRTGVSNKINFAITPSLKLDYEVIDRVHLNGGLGVRTLRPTLQGGLKIDLY